MRALPDRPSLRRWDGWRRDATSWTPPARRTVVVVPHPDDESLATGGLIRHQTGRGLEVLVVAVTDGDAAYDADGDDELAATRRAEQLAALSVLGVDDDATVRLGLPDGRVAEREVELVEALGSLIDRDSMLIAPWCHDLHPDHEAVGRAALATADKVGVSLYSSLFWAWHLGPLSAMPAESPCALDLSDEVSVAKRSAIACHRSQFEMWGDTPPILDDSLLEPARWPAEYYIEARR